MEVSTVAGELYGAVKFGDFGDGDSCGFGFGLIGRHEDKRGEEGEGGGNGDGCQSDGPRVGLSE